jgi:hypothetical protein
VLESDDGTFRVVDSRTVVIFKEVPKVTFHYRISGNAITFAAVIARAVPRSDVPGPSRWHIPARAGSAYAELAAECASAGPRRAHNLDDLADSANQAGGSRLLSSRSPRKPAEGGCSEYGVCD